MTSPAITCHVNDPLTLAAKRMGDGDIGVVPVVNDDGKLTGIVTDRDICMAAYTQGRGLDELLVHSAMSHHVIATSPDTTLSEVEQLMAKHQIRRVPIVDAEGMPIGIVSMNDLAIAGIHPKSEMTHEPSTIAYALAAICAHRNPNQQVA
jgi:CBS domain-containing protein